MTMKRIEFKESDKIFSTGVFLKPEKVVINDIDQWRWVAVGFEDDSYFEGELISINDYADKLEDLFVNEY
jgi:hypothetical protein